MACKIDAFVTRSENENEKGLHEIAVERERIIKGKKITLRRLEKKTISCFTYVGIWVWNIFVFMVIFFDMRRKNSFHCFHLVEFFRDFFCWFWDMILDIQSILSSFWWYDATKWKRQNGQKNATKHCVSKDKRMKIHMKRDKKGSQWHNIQFESSRSHEIK